MSSFAVETTINAPIHDVWHALADIGNIHAWNPGVKASHTTSSIQEGVGATRFCNLGGKNYLDEEVVAWEPNKQLTMRITDTNLPFASADIHFYLNPRAPDKTAVTVSPEYILKFGPLGTLLDQCYVRKSYKQGMRSLLSGLKLHVEKERMPQ